MKAFLAFALPIAAIANEQGETVYTADALKDQIHNLPGVPANINFNQFAGYITLPGATSAHDRHMFYWYVESQTNPSTAPLFLWSNGGPGCSGMAGFLTEQGPFRVGLNGTSLLYNTYSWNKIVNMVFIEQPVGVGFSYLEKPDNSFEYGDAQAAEDNYRFTVKFFERYPHLKSNDFYISSESYGGHYMPTLAKKIVTAGGVTNFKGVFLGNPFTYMPYRDYGFYGTAWGHQLLPKPLWDEYLENDCKTDDSYTCRVITYQMSRHLHGLDLYALDFPKCIGPEATGQQERLAILKKIAHATNTKEQSHLAYQPCSEDLAHHYLNLPEVKKAIHAKADIEWEMCSDMVHAYYNSTDLMQPMMPCWTYLIEKANLNIMIYSGDNDAICATLGTQQFMWDLGYDAAKDKMWSTWKVAGQVAGYYTVFDVPKGSFSFVTVHGAGHMVPSTQPERCFALLTHFLQKTWVGGPATLAQF